MKPGADGMRLANVGRAGHHEIRACVKFALVWLAQEPFNIEMLATRTRATEN